MSIGVTSALPIIEPALLPDCVTRAGASGKGREGAKEGVGAAGSGADPRSSTPVGWADGSGVSAGRTGFARAAESAESSESSELGRTGCAGTSTGAGDKTESNFFLKKLNIG